MAGTKNKENKKKNNTVSRQKVLSPTLKEQQRYVVYAVIMQDSLKNPFNKVHDNIISQCSTLMGMFDGGLAGLMGVKFDAQKMRGIIRVNNKYVDKLKVCLGMIKDSYGEKMALDCIYVSGMVNKAEGKMNS